MRSTSVALAAADLITDPGEGAAELPWLDLGCTVCHSDSARDDGLEAGPVSLDAAVIHEAISLGGVGVVELLGMGLGGGGAVR